MFQSLLILISLFQVSSSFPEYYQRCVWLVLEPLPHKAPWNIHFLRECIYACFLDVSMFMLALTLYAVFLKDPGKPLLGCRKGCKVVIVHNFIVLFTFPYVYTQFVFYGSHGPSSKRVF